MKLALCLLLLQPAAILAQAKLTATGPGTYVSVGASGSAFQADYGHRRILGGTVFVDAHLYRSMGVELEATTLRARGTISTRQSTYLVGPRLSSRGRSLRTAVKLLVGRGTFTFPYGDAHGNYFVVAPGTSLEWYPPHSRLSVRLLDAEYQFWPNFTYGPLHPYGISSGISFRLY